MEVYLYVGLWINDEPNVCLYYCIQDFVVILVSEILTEMIIYLSEQNLLQKKLNQFQTWVNNNILLF